MEHSDAMSFPVCAWPHYLACFFPVSLCLQTRLVLDDSRTVVVVAGGGGNSVLSEDAQRAFVGGLQTLAPLAVSSRQLLCDEADAKEPE